MPFNEVKDFIRQKLTQEKQTEMVQKYIEDLKKNAKVVVNADLLKEEGKQAETPAKTEEGVKTQGTTTPAAGTEKSEATAKPEPKQQGNAPAKTGPETAK